MVITGTVIAEINQKEIEFDYEVNFHDHDDYKIKVWPVDDNAIDEGSFDAIEDRLEQLALDDAVLKVENTIK